MDILICSKLFFPDNDIGAVRVSNFAKYLNDRGHRVTVLTGVAKVTILSKTLNNSIKVERIAHSKAALKLISKVENALITRHTVTAFVPAEPEKKLSFVNAIYRTFKSFRLQGYNLYLQFDWFFQTRRVIRKTVALNHDVVISSFGPLGSHLVARYLKKIKRVDAWIADLRDNMQNEEYPKIINLLYSYFEKDMMARADAITVVSKGQYNMLQNAVGLRHFKNKKVNIVYNGYEKEIGLRSKKEQLKSLKIAYTGSLYGGKRDMSLLFKSVRELISEKQIELNHIEIHYAGTSSADLFNQASVYEIQEIIRDHGYLSRDASIKLQESSDILVVLSWNTQREQGVLSGKFFEYIQALKPIIAITGGDVADSELTEMVKDLNVGIACEYIKGKADLDILKKYISLQYNLAMMGDMLFFEPDREKIGSFHYKNIVEQVEKICIELLQK